MAGRHRGWAAALSLIVLLVLGRSAAADIPGWQREWPSPQQMLQGRDPAMVQKFLDLSAALERNPNDTVALDNRGYYAMEFAKNGLYRTFWQWLAAKDLERSVQLNPNDFYAWHNYGDLNYNAGDAWMMNDHSNAKRAVSAFTRAIALKPDSARSYMGRGWAYLAMDDPADARVDFEKALQLDPSLRASLEREIAGIQERKRQEAGARGTVAQMGRYYVERSARTNEQCQAYKGLWTQNECRISMALYPGPKQSWEAP